MATLAEKWLEQGEMQRGERYHKHTGVRGGIHRLLVKTGVLNNLALSYK